MTRLAAAVVRHRITVTLLGLLVAVLAAVLGAGTQERLSNGGFDDPAAQSVAADKLLVDRFGGGVPNLVIIASAPGGVDEPDASATGLRLASQAASVPGVAAARSYWDLGRPTALKSRDGDSALVLVRLAGDEDQVRQAADRLVDDLGGRFEGLSLKVTGSAQVSVEIERQSEIDLKKAELIAAPVTLLLLVLVFGSLVSAVLPLVVGALSVLSATLVLRVLASLTPVSVFSLNITSALGLGLAIDYSLFMVTRFREELERDPDVGTAIRATLQTAGRTVAFSAVTVALSLSAMLVFPLYFLRSFAYGGIAVVLLTAVFSLTLLPGLLALLGHRVNSLDLLKPFRRRRTTKTGAEGAWHRVAVLVMRRPLPVALVAMTFLLVLGSPFLRASFGLTDDRVLPAGAAARDASQVLREDFPSRETTASSVVMADYPGNASDPRLGDYAETLSRLPSVGRVDAAGGSWVAGEKVVPATPLSARFTSGDATWLSVVATAEPYSDAGKELVRALRAVPAPQPALIGGQAAKLVDTEGALRRGLPLAMLIIFAATTVLLFLFTGSVLVPIKAIALNMLSLSATFGAMVWIFQEGHLKWLVGDFADTGLIDITMPVLMFCIAFGLSMDYEVFLLSRIREAYLVSGDNTRAVAYGIEQTGRLISAAAVLIAAVLLAFATSGLTILKLLGVGLALAVIVDATIVRGLLVPAFMRMAGDANWWAPGPLRRLHQRIGLSDARPDSPGDRAAEPLSRELV